MTKSATKAAIRALPALRTSLRWYKRETVRDLRNRAESVTAPKLRAAIAAKAGQVAKADLADLRAGYEAGRVNEIVRARRFELARAVPAIVWLTA